MNLFSFVQNHFAGLISHSYNLLPRTLVLSLNPKNTQLMLQLESHGLYKILGAVLASRWHITTSSVP